MVIKVVIVWVLENNKYEIVVKEKYKFVHKSMQK